MIFIHGFMGDATDFDALIASGDTVLELPGHGAHADIPNDWGEVVAQMVANLPDEPCHLVGYSMGGRVALGMAAVAPEKIDKLTLISAHPGLGDDERSRRRVIDQKRAAELASNPDAFLETWASLPMFGPQIGPAWERYRRRNRSSGWSEALTVLSVAEQPDFRPILNDLDLLMIVGEHDVKYVELASTLTTPTAVVVDAWHAVHRDQPTEVLRILRER